MEVNRRLDFSNADPEEACEAVSVGLDWVFLKLKLIFVVIKATPHLQVGPRGPDESELSRSADVSMLEPRTGPLAHASDASASPADVLTSDLCLTSELSGHALLKGMKGYQLTPSDLEFIRAMQEDKLLRTLQV